MLSEKGIFFRTEFHNFAPKWIELDYIKSSTMSTLRNWVKGIAFFEAVDLVFQELLENLMRYADWNPKTSPRLEVSCTEGPTVQIVTVNIPLEGSGDLQRLERKVAQLQNEADSSAAHTDALEEKMFRKKPEESAELGLIRIVREAGGTLETEITDSNIVRVQVTVSIASILDAARKRVLPKR